MEAKIYNKSGQEEGKISLDDKLFGLKWNADLVHQVITSMQNNARVNVAHTKSRGEVSGGGKKPWRQKGTGRARHGSTRSPIWVGGGVAHGPRNEREFACKINKKMKTKALFTILSRKLRDGELVFVADLSFATPKASEAQKAVNSLAGIKGLEKISYKTGKRAYVALPEKNDNTLLSFRNFKSIKVEEARNANPLDLMNYKYIVVVSPKDSLQTLVGRVK
ncbi:MAG: 50S ribosomal protein L4 [Candidatus Vogelbacteria bacterium RIFOXYD1_FULL_44_32]|uniref:Large ribosomal subunit protein uL4 n=1 Tax=Candidatus Vogelbacteria bacterium RIFOXYD1_FULL_44_32 TaxID=1802438 RepID=A0A1G2QEF5_9BACT|nr:MAG: 50S ribosomal protein L4 [Candidatus Vogelbacteria bacterium RIFOXYD1_FULL_44_32]